MVPQSVANVIEHVVVTQFYLMMTENSSTSILVFVSYRRKEFPQQQIIMQPIFPIIFTIHLTHHVVLDLTASIAHMDGPGGMQTLFGKNLSYYQQKLKLTILTLVGNKDI